MRFVWLLAAGTVWAQAPSAIEQQRAAMARQRESIRQQAEHLGVWMGPGSRPGGAPAAAEDSDCDRIDEAEIAPIIDTAAKAHDVQPKLVRAVIEQESAFRPCAVSNKGAQGLMQLMPGTAAQMMVKDPFDPRENVDAGTRFLKQLIDKYKGDLAQALGAYNAGPSAVDQAGKVPNFPETQGYVNSILAKMGITRTDPPNIRMPTPTEN